MRIFALILSVLFLVGCVVDGEQSDGTWEFCDGQAQCPRGYVELPEGSSCSADSAESCTEVSACGTTIQCEAPSNCEAVPTCPDGTNEVPADYECPPEEICFSVTECNMTIQCSEPPACDGPPPSCPDGATEVASSSDCPRGDVSCWEITESTCGQSVWCWEESTSCQCPDGDPDCLEESDSGRVYFDECPPLMCDGPPEMCEPCYEYGPYFEDECGCGCEPPPPEYCAVSDAEGEGECLAILGYAFDGQECVKIGGCECFGEDCDRFASLEECQRTTGDCDGTCGDPDAPICAAFEPPSDEPTSPRDCPEGSTFTVINCMPQCVEADSCEPFDEAP